MIHAWDHFDYTNDVQWWKSQGYPLVKVIMLVAFETKLHDATLVGCCEFPP